MAFVWRSLFLSNILFVSAANNEGRCTLAQQEHPATEGVDDAEDYASYLQSRIQATEAVKRVKAAPLHEATEDKQLMQSEVSSLLQKGSNVATEEVTTNFTHPRNAKQAEEERLFTMDRLHPMVVPLLDRAKIWMLWPVCVTMIVACLLSVGIVLHMCGAPTSAEKASLPVEFALEERKTETTGSEKESAEETATGIDERILAAWRRDAAFQPMLDEEIEAVSRGSSDTDEELPEADTESEPEGEEVELQTQRSETG
mmetsp:Transcript_95459/g.179592  ORF Transcript_95459/g.179592 Transcript_95459/m.179592 type:complete len:257 (-) Transcript_95459:37-807(-)